MKLRVIGCHGGSSPEHNNVSFVVDDTIAIDAGSLASGMPLEDQARLETILVTHSHLDHVGDLGSLCDVRAQQEGKTITVAGIPEAIAGLREHFFNNVLWPDFAAIDSGHGPALVYHELQPEVAETFGALRVTPIMVHHSVPSCGFLLDEGRGTVAYSGDTGPTDRFWEALNELEDVQALITEVSFPNQMSELAAASKHLTPTTLMEQLAKLDRRPARGVFVYGMKPVFLGEIEAEMRALNDDGIRILCTGDEFEF